MANFIFECVDCNKHYLDSEVTYLCPTCSAQFKPMQPLKGVLKILYDYEGISKRFIVDRLKENCEKGVWRYNELLPIKDRHTIPPLMTGKTPLKSANRLSIILGLSELYLKDDTVLPTGSFKDRASMLVVGRAQETKQDVLVAASTGNAASSLAGMCACVGKKCIIFCPESAPIAKLTQIAVYGAKLIAVKGTYDHAFDLSIEMTNHFGWYNRNTAFNPFTIEGKKTAALEIWEDLNYCAPDKILIPVGDGAILAGIAKGFDDLKALGLIEKLPQLIACQAEGSCAIVKALESGQDHVKPHRGAKTIADSICVEAPRNGIWAIKALRESEGFGIVVSDNEIIEAIKILGELEGIFAEPAAACTIAALKKLVDSGQIASDETVVALITGNGLKDINASSKVVQINQPIEPTIKAVKSILD